MKINIEENINLLEEEILIKCKKENERIQSIVSSIKLFDETITAKKEGRSYLIPLLDVYYFESVDDTVFCYTNNETYSTNFKLYEIEEVFKDSTLVRINKTMVVNIGKIVSFKAQLNGRMDAILQNKEKVEISRNYVPLLKEKLGGLSK